MNHNRCCAPGPSIQTHQQTTRHQIGHIPFADGQADVGTFNMPVTSTGPMFLYCATGPHCQLGQVMIVNPADSQQLANYAKASQLSGKSVDGGAVTGGTTGRIALGAAAFVPAPPEAAAAPPPAAPPAASSAAPAPSASTPPAASSAAPAPA
ncbi:extracellular serine-rich [Pyrenophora seminiperda CCB06]|uniref:Extracellular serine-rich n=1 Tax=Pyrenophora seminiperda CCB06 TaxID=1302712 RepID=A0A3M7ME06_9PLEO|nr:extracellular serine-rich [Pyrenophora seminiperda CCB06]